MSALAPGAQAAPSEVLVARLMAASTERDGLRIADAPLRLPQAIQVEIPQLEMPPWLLNARRVAK